MTDGRRTWCRTQAHHPSLRRFGNPTICCGGPSGIVRTQYWAVARTVYAMLLVGSHLDLRTSFPVHTVLPHIAKSTLESSRSRSNSTLTACTAEHSGTKPSKQKRNLALGNHARPAHTALSWYKRVDVDTRSYGDGPTGLPQSPIWFSRPCPRWMGSGANTFYTGLGCWDGTVAPG